MKKNRIGRSSFYVVEFTYNSLVHVLEGDGTVALDLYRDIWGGDPAEAHNVIHTTVSRLNKKLDGVNAGVRVSFNRGEGYTLENW